VWEDGTENLLSPSYPILRSFRTLSQGMKKFLIALSFLTVQTAYSCPNFTGNYMVTDSDGYGEEHLDLAQNGCESLTVHLYFSNSSTGITLDQTRTVLLNGQMQSVSSGDPSVTSSYSFDASGVLTIATIEQTGAPTIYSRWFLDADSNLVAQSDSGGQTFLRQ